jgi:hypothetical protein
MQSDAPESETSLPIACTLTPKRIPGQVAEWGDLVAQTDHVVRIDGGVRLEAPASLAAGVLDLIERERSCCSFLDITAKVAGSTLSIEITSTHADALPVIWMLAGLPVG